MLGPNAAERLGITTVDNLPAVRIGDQLYLVIGILDGAARQADLLGAVIIPEGTARREFRLASPELVEVETDIGATTVVADQAPRRRCAPTTRTRSAWRSRRSPRGSAPEVQSDLDSCSSCSAASRCWSARSASPTSRWSR